jgi:amino acid transporter
MSVRDGFIYNVLAMGAIFPWFYVWGPAAFPNANIYWALIIAFIAQVPISLSYSFLASALPVDAGDYVYQLRAFGRLGSIAVLSGFVVCILEWLPISGWLFATLGVAPLFLSAGVQFGAKFRLLTQIGVAVESPGGTLIVSLVVNLLGVLLLVKGLRYFAYIQRYLFALTILAIAVMSMVFLQKDALLHLNTFASTIADQLKIHLPMLGNGFSDLVVADGINHKSTQGGGFGRLASTLGLVPIVWTSLQWATYSVEQNEEIEGAKIHKNQLIMLLYSAGAVTVLLLIVAASQQHGLRLKSENDPQALLRSFDAINWSGNGSPGMVEFSRRVLQPYPNVLAIASSGSLGLSVLIALGFLANAFQITCNCFIGMGKIITAMSRDGILPRPLAAGIDPRTNAPVRAYWAYWIIGVPVIVMYGIVPHWSDYALGVVTLACGYVFLLTALAATRLPTERFREDLEKSDIRAMPGWLFRAAGYTGTAFSFLMVASCAFLPQFGLRGGIPFLALAVIILTCSTVILSRKTPQPEPEVENTAARAAGA